MNKVLVTVSAILLHLCLGSIYAWSIVINTVNDIIDISITELVFIFGITIFCLGLTATYFGNHNYTWSYKRLCITVFVLFLLGISVSELGIQTSSFALLLLGYGIIIGIATGIGYLLPIPILMTWYNKYKGIAAGSVITGFGMSAIIMSHAYSYVYSLIGLNYSFFIVEVSLSLLIIPSIFFLRPKYEIENVDKKCVSLFEAFRSENFRQLWILFFINICVGVSLISCLAPLTDEVFHLIDVDIVLLVGLTGLANGIGRFIWSFLSDIIGRPLTVSIMIAFELVAVLSLIFFHSYESYRICVLMIISCYGGMFAIMPAYISDLFGNNMVKQYFSLMLMAWGIAGLIAPISLRLIYVYYASYHYFFYGICILCGINLVISHILVERNIKEL